MAEENKSMIYIVAIVAIVAVVALVMMVMNRPAGVATSASLSTGEDATGNAMEAFSLAINRCNANWDTRESLYGCYEAASYRYTGSGDAANNLIGALS